MNSADSQWVMDRPVIGFLGYRLDTVTRQLFAPDGVAVALSGRAFEVLAYLAANHDRVVSRDELLANVWAGRVVEENNLTQAILSLRRTFGTDASDHRFILTVTGRGYRFVAALEDPDARQDASRTMTSSAGDGATHEPAAWQRRLRWGVLAALVLAVSVLAITALRDRPRSAASTSASSAPPPTLAVLPFKTIAGDRAGDVDAMLELGMAETLIARLSRSTSLRVLSLGSIQEFTDRKRDPLRTGMSLGADYVVDGSTQHVGDSIRVNARLISLPDGRTVWAGTFDQSPDHVFTLQDALAEGMSSALSLQYAAGTAHLSPCNGSDAVAYRAYLRGLHLTNRPNRFTLPVAIAAFEEAIEHDPRCARAWAGLAFAYRGVVMTADGDPRKYFPMVKAAVAKALSIDPDSAEAYASKGVAEFWYDWDWAAAERSLRHAIDLNDNLSEAHYALAHLLYNIGRGDEAEPYARKAMLLDPLSPIINTIMARVLMSNGHQQEAVSRIEKVLEHDPDFWVALFFHARIQMARGDSAGGMRDLRRANKACGGCGHAQTLLAGAYAAVGDRRGAERILAEMQRRARIGYVPATHLALVHEALGDHAHALDLLERGYRQRDLNMSFLIVDGRWRGLWQEPRFGALLERMHLQLPDAGPGPRPEDLQDH